MKKVIVAAAILIFLTGCGKPPVDQAKAKSKTTTSTVAGKQYANILAQGVSDLKESDLAGAIKSFDEAIKRDPFNPAGYIVLGQVYLNMKKFDRAIDTFRAAIRVDPENGEAYYLLATTLGIAGNKEEALKVAQQSIEKFRAAQDQQNFLKAIALLQGLSSVQDEEATKESDTATIDTQKKQ